MKQRHKQHVVALTFSVPVTEAYARQHLARVSRAVDAFATLSEMAWDNAKRAKIVKTAVKRRPGATP